jgi:colicin import membrane protein
MNVRWGSAFFLSATLHGAVIALAFLMMLVARLYVEKPPPILELVAGEGDNFSAREAPALGTPRVKLDVPAPPPQPAPPKPQPAPPEPAPITPAPVPPVPKKVEPPPPNFTKDIKRKLIIAESKTKREIAKERAAEAKRIEEEKKKLTKEEFDRMNKAKTTPPQKTPPPKIAKIDVEGITKGVVGGSKSNTKGGAGGKALVSNSDDVMAQYFRMLLERVRREFELPPTVSDTLEVSVEFRSSADGSISNPRVLKSSGSREFDQAVLAAIRRVTMPPRPDKKSETVKFLFTMRELDER